MTGRWIRASGSAALVMCAALTRAIVAPLSAGQPTPPGEVISPDIMKAYTSAIADDRMEGRETGTRGFERAAEYVAAEFRRLHVPPARGGYLQQFDMFRGRVDERATTIEITGGAGRAALQYGTDFVSYGSVAATLLVGAGPIVDAGLGVTVPSGERDDYANVPARGAVVLVSLEQPHGLSAAGERYATFRERIANATAHGAVGALFIDAPDIGWDIRVRAARQLGATATDRLAAPRIPVAVVNPARARQLVDTAHEHLSAALRIPMEIRKVRAANVVAVLGGGDPSTRHEHVAFVAHLDHVGIGVPANGDGIYNGAVDNASGVAALLAIARGFRSMPPVPRSVIFVATGGEEEGEIGAEYLVAHPPIDGRIVAAINMDGASIVPFTTADAAGGSGSFLGRDAQDAGRQLGVVITLEPSEVEGSDDAPFSRAGIPALWIHAALPDGWMDAYYHTPRDDLRQPLDYAAMARFARLNFLTGYAAAGNQEAR